MYTLAFIFTLLFATVSFAGTHQVVFNSNCPTSYLQIPGHGNYKPGTYTFNGDVSAAIASAGPSCSVDGNNCASVEFTLNSAGTSTGDITLIPPHKSTSQVNFHMTPGGSSASCNDQNCGKDNAFYQPTDYSAQRYESSPDSGIVINFTC